MTIPGGDLNSRFKNNMCKFERLYEQFVVIFWLNECKNKSFWHRKTYWYKKLKLRIYESCSHEFKVLQSVFFLIQNEVLL